MRRPEEAAKMTTRKYDEALFQNAGKVIVVNCDTCDFESYVREVEDEASTHMLSTSWHSPARIVHGLGVAWDRSDDG
jgi:hypothetical protein